MKEKIGFDNLKRKDSDLKKNWEEAGESFLRFATKKIEGLMGGN